jgi:hypothetical protein
MQEKLGGRVVPDVHGLQVYPDDLPAAAINLTARGRVSRPVARLLGPLRSELAGNRQLGKKEALAMDLYFLSQFESSTRARVLALVTSLEVLSERQSRPQPVVAHLEQLKKQTKDALRDADTETQRAFNSFLSGLGQLCDESISSAVRSVVRQHVPDTKQFDGMSPIDFFNKCYDVRSKLVHAGEEPEDVTLTQLFGELSRLVQVVLFSVAGVGS